MKTFFASVATAFALALPALAQSNEVVTISFHCGDAVLEEVSTLTVDGLVSHERVKIRDQVVMKVWYDDQDQPVRADMLQSAGWVTIDENLADARVTDLLHYIVVNYGANWDELQTCVQATRAKAITSVLDSMDSLLKQTTE